MSAKRVFLAGSGWFGMSAAERLTEEGHEVAAVSAPADARSGEGRDLLALWAARTGAPVVPPAAVSPSVVPEGCDLIVAAHSHAFVGRRTRASAGDAIGYHPSLLPLHRGRDAVRWQARLRERVVGGTVYRLTDRVDGGPILLQRHLVVPAGLTASGLWRGYLAPLGLDLLAEAVDRHESIVAVPQDDELATWEPSFDSEPVYRPELLEIGAGR